MWVRPTPGCTLFIYNPGSAMKDSSGKKNLIGIFDSGVGGLSVLREIHRLMPEAPIFYLADQAHVPYGKRGLEEIRGLLFAITRFLQDQGARLIAVFTQGRYQYSLKANDYLDMTRDFMQSTDTKSFDVFRVKRRSNSAYTLSAKHVYRGRDGETHTVYLSFALERIGQYWTITQVDTSPERL